MVDLCSFPSLPSYQDYYEITYKELDSRIKYLENSLENMPKTAEERANLGVAYFFLIAVIVSLAFIVNLGLGVLVLVVGIVVFIESWKTTAYGGGHGMKATP